MTDQLSTAHVVCSLGLAVFGYIIGMLFNFPD